MKSLTCLSLIGMFVVSTEMSQLARADYATEFAYKVADHCTKKSYLWPITDSRATCIETAKYNAGLYTGILRDVQSAIDSKTHLKQKREFSIAKIDELKQRVDNQGKFMGVNFRNLIITPELDESLRVARSAANHFDFKMLSAKVKDTILELQTFQQNLR